MAGPGIIGFGLLRPLRCWQPKPEGLKGVLTTGMNIELIAG